MGSKFSRRRLAGSAILAIAIVVISYVSVIPGGASHVTASNTNELLKTLASKDADGDGLLDWEESLYGTDPQNPRSVQEDLTDSEAVAQGLVSISAPEAPAIATDANADEIGPGAATGSLTEQFAQILFGQFSNYLQENEGSATNITSADFITDLVTSFETTTDDMLASRYALSSIIMSPSVSVAQYTTAVENTFKRPGTGVADAGNLGTLIESALADTGGESARNDLATLSAFYVGVARDLAKVPVPSILADNHLLLVQSFDLLGISFGAISHVQEDPLVALAAIAAIDSGPKGIGTAFENILNEVSRSYGTPQAASDPGILIRALVSSPL